MELFAQILVESWRILQESSVYILFGIFVAGLLRVFLSPEAVARHLGEGRFRSVFKAALMGIPIPLCSCGVLPAAVSLKKQGANNGATTAFLISTPESGVDSIALTYALMGPVMTVARPVAAFVTAAGAGMAENLLSRETGNGQVVPDLSCPVDNCCDGVDCPPAVHRSHHTFVQKLRAGMNYALIDLWGDIAAWFFIGVLLAGVITVALPSEFMARYLGGGLPSMLLMLGLGIPLYICATASTPIAAAFILKGVSPGAALVFLLAGPATNVTSLAVLLKTLGKRATAIYLLGIAGMSVACGLVLDEIYGLWGISAQALASRASEIVPHGVEIMGAFAVAVLSLKPLYAALRSGLMRLKGKAGVEASCCTSGTCGPVEKDITGCHCHDPDSVTAFPCPPQVRS